MQKRGLMFDSDKSFHFGVSFSYILYTALITSHFYTNY